jgi:hypothetical protein
MTFKNAETILELSQAYRILTNLEDSYPEFQNWYWNKVVPGVSLNNDKVILGFNKNNIVGISIIKDGNEKKLRALRIDEKYHKKGYGLYLLDESLKQLNCDKPLTSVSETMINDYSRIFINRYDFDLTYVHKGLYMKNKLEYQFNGEKKSLINSEFPF